MKIEPVTLEGRFVRLEPMRPEHGGTLFEIGSDAELWRWTTASISRAEHMERYVQTALAEQEQGTALPFVTVDRSSGQIVGSTRFGRISTENRRVEIGWTWISPRWQRTFINTEAKLLMLCHSFETWKCIRVEIITDVLNEKSRRAIERLGAVEEGIFRKHLIVDSGRVRDSVVFSIVDSDWPAVRENLESKLRSHQ